MKREKEPGYSLIEEKNKTYTFLAGDSSNPLSGLIYSKHQSELNIWLRDVGYQPDKKCVVCDIDEDEQKETILSHHSERLAIVNERVLADLMQILIFFLLIEFY